MKAKAHFFPGMTRRDGDPDALKAEAPVPRDTRREIPKWLEREMVDLRFEIDADMPFPNAYAPGPWHLSHPGRFRPGLLYFEALAVWPERVTHVMIVPWLKRGGGDLVAINFAKAIAAQAGTSLIVVGTEPQPSPWIGRLPDGAVFFDLGALCIAATDDESVAVLARLIVQNPPCVLHVFASRVGWKLLANHGSAISNLGILTYACSFCEDGRDAGGSSYGYAYHYLNLSYKYLNHVISDSEDHPARLRALHGYPENLFKVVRIPTDVIGLKGPKAEPGALRVLWAGRLDVQKRPDLLAQIAQAMPDVDFHVYGAPLLASQSAAMRTLERCSNVSLKGAYDGFGEIREVGYGAFLYTSLWDGVPNVLLEAGARRLPVVASDAGGIRELIGPATGWLVSGEVRNYIDALRECLEFPNSAKLRAQALYEVVAKRHSVAAFQDSVRSIEGYLTEECRASGEDNCGPRSLDGIRGVTDHYRY